MVDTIQKENTMVVVVWYNPTGKERDAVRLYEKDVCQVIVVDNSETDNSVLCESLLNAHYIGLGKNFGIAAALNRGCEWAKREGAEWILTMDQDSQWNQHSVVEYMDMANGYEEIDKVGIFSPFHDCDGHPETHHRNGKYERKNALMCSGNLLRLRAWEQTNGFKEDFFIDLVDDEMCCHLRELGWYVVRCNDIFLSHQLGTGVLYTRIGHHPYIGHSAWRYYYIARNMRWMMKLYPHDITYYHKQYWKAFKRLVLYERSNKLRKIIQFIYGWKDSNKS